MRAHFVKVTSTTVSPTHVTMVPASMALPATPVIVNLVTQGIAVRIN